MRKSFKPRLKHYYYFARIFFGVKMFSFLLVYSLSLTREIQPPFRRLRLPISYYAIKINIRSQLSIEIDIYKIVEKFHNGLPHADRKFKQFAAMMHLMKDPQ